ncbi:MAG: MBL fold metallo-hydrolase [Clostridia bacterium]|nr:MBL fold metallo-hydrolase [Clostridia bacterium]
MRSQVRKYKNMVVATVAAAILILSVIGYITDAISDLKEALFPGQITNKNSYVEMFDVGQGDSILIYSGKKAALIDTGIKTYADDIIRELKDKGIKSLDLLLITHNHNDHMGGIVPLTERIKVKKIIVPDLSKTDERTDKMQTAMANVKRGGGQSTVAERGMSFKIGDFDIDVIGCYYDEKDENDRSIITKAKIGKWKFLFMGDAQDPAERRLIGDGADVRCDVLKLGHHGSMYGTSEEFLKASSPSFAMISCGRGNRYSHPHDVVLLRLKEAGVQFWRTDTSGNITFDITEKEITVSTEK